MIGTGRDEESERERQDLFQRLCPTTAEDGGEVVRQEVPGAGSGVPGLALWEAGAGASEAMGEWRGGGKYLPPQAVGRPCRGE